MAEYYISYRELEKLFDQYIAETPNNSQLLEHKAEILAALTGDYEQGNWDSANEMISLWENQIDKPSQLLLGVKIHSSATNYVGFPKSVLYIGVN